MILDSALIKYGNHYPQVFLKKCQDIEKKAATHINDNLGGLMSLMKNNLFKLHFCCLVREKSLCNGLKSPQCIKVSAVDKSV